MRGYMRVITSKAAVDVGCAYLEASYSVSLQHIHTRKRSRRQAREISLE